MHPPGPWKTRLHRGEPRDHQVCPETGLPDAMEAWRAPLTVLVPGLCANCGIPRTAEEPCAGCGLGRAEEASLHAEMASGLGCESLCEAAEQAARRGGHVLAIKLATAAWHQGESKPRARLLRLRELVAADKEEQAAEEAGDWVLQSGSPVPAITETLSRAGSRNAAIHVLDKALAARQDPTLLLLRARFYLQEGEELVAAEDAGLAANTGGRHVSRPALALLAEIVDGLHAEGRLDEALAAIGSGAPLAHRHSKFTYRVACVHEERGEYAEARKWFVHTLRLDRQHRGARARLPDIEDRLGVASTLNSLG